MTAVATIEYPVKAAVFETTQAATLAVRELRKAGFSSDQISVICSRDHAHDHFGDCHLEATHDQTDATLSSGTIAAMGLGSAVVATAVVLSGGGALVAIGAFAGLALAGTLAAVFSSRGVGKETADFHEQALQSGNLLVAVEVHSDDAELWLERAEEVFREAGAVPVSLAEG